MTFQPVLPAIVLVALTAAFTVIRLLTLREVLRRRRPGRNDHALLRWCGVTLTVLLLMVAAARPTLGASQPGSFPAAQADGGSNINVFFVVDRSPDSRVEDFGDRKTRMSGMRDDMLALIDRYPRARFGVISFSSRPTVDWPLSDDVWSLRPVVAGLGPYFPAPLERVDAGAASSTLRYKLLQSQAQYPGSKNVVFYLGSGGPESPAPQSAFDVESTALAGGAVLGYGTSAGGASPINEQVLREIAGELGVSYLHRDGGVGVDQAGVAALGGTDAASAATGASQPVELYWAFTIPAAMLLLVELYLTVRWFRRSRSAPEVTL